MWMRESSQGGTVEAMEETISRLYMAGMRKHDGTTIDRRISCANRARREGRYSCKTHLVIIHPNSAPEAHSIETLKCCFHSAETPSSIARGEGFQNTYHYHLKQVVYLLA